MSWLSWLMLQWTRGCRCLFYPPISFGSVSRSGIAWSCDSLFLTFRGSFLVFPIAAAPSRTERQVLTVMLVSWSCRCFIARLGCVWGQSLRLSTCHGAHVSPPALFLRLAASFLPKCWGPRVWSLILSISFHHGTEVCSPPTNSVFPINWVV